MMLLIIYLPQQAKELFSKLLHVDMGTYVEFDNMKFKLLENNEYYFIRYEENGRFGSFKVSNLPKSISNPPSNHQKRKQDQEPIPSSPEKKQKIIAGKPESDNEEYLEYSEDNEDLIFCPRKADTSSENEDLEGEKRLYWHYYRGTKPVITTLVRNELPNIEMVRAHLESLSEKQLEEYPFLGGKTKKDVINDILTILK